MKGKTWENVISKDGEVGHTEGKAHRCRLEGCSGMRLHVKWNDEKMTYPCTKGMRFEDGVWYIL